MSDTPHSHASASPAATAPAGGRVYLDNNATTRTDPRALAAMQPYFTEIYANASSTHGDGARAAQAVARGREQLAALIGAHPQEVFFTSGGTEADNLAIAGLLAAQPDRRHVVTTAVEHLAVLYPCRHLELGGVEVSYLGVDGSGRLDLAALGRIAGPETAVVSIMLANNETGVLFPVDEAARIVHERGSWLHVDGVQGLGKVPVDVAASGVDLMSFSAHKLHGPKGIGALYVREGTPIAASTFGGSQERGLRPGTENVPGIVGFGAAAALAGTGLAEAAARTGALRDRLEQAALDSFTGAVVHGRGQPRLPNTANVSFPGWDARDLLAELDLHGIDASGGSACCARTNRPSHVLEAMGVPAELARAAIRFSLSRETTAAEVDAAISALRRIAAQGPRPQSMVSTPAAGTGAPPPMVRAATAPATRPSEEMQMTDEHVPPPAVTAGAAAGSLVYALGQIGRDFGTEARREAFLDFMREHRIGDTPHPQDDEQWGRFVAAHPEMADRRVAYLDFWPDAQTMAADPDPEDERTWDAFAQRHPEHTESRDWLSEYRRDNQPAGREPDPDNDQQWARFLESQPEQAEGHIWTLKVDDVPVYAVQPEGNFADKVFQPLCRALVGHGMGADDEKRVELACVPGTVAGAQRLLNGTTVPLIRPEARGVRELTLTELVRRVLDKCPQGLSGEQQASLRAAVRRFLERALYEHRNLGTDAGDRALNFLVSHPRPLAEVFVDAVDRDMDLHAIEVAPARLSRAGSDFQEVRLTFFDSSRPMDTARRAYAVTVDVVHAIPAMVGSVRSWAAF